MNKISTFPWCWIRLHYCVSQGFPLILSTFWISAMSLWADSVLSGLQWRLLWKTWACRRAGLCPWWGTNKHDRGSFLFLQEKVTEATPCCACWCFCLRRSAGSYCSRSTCWCWHCWAHGECSGHTTAPPERHRGTVGHKEIYEHQFHMEFQYVFPVLPHILHTQPLQSQFDSRYTL